MFKQHIFSTHKEPVFRILTAAVAVSAWLTFGAVSDLPGAHYMPNSTVSECENMADVMAALDRSRNGVSLTCNRDVLRASTVR